MMEHQKAAEHILQQRKAARIAVYGDFYIDACWLLNPKGGEVSVETGLQTETVANQSYALGGAANVVANLAALEPAHIMTIGAVGNDIFGRELIRQLKHLGADTQGLVVPEHDFDTYGYCTQYVHDQAKFRVDFGYHNTRSIQTDEMLIEYLERALATCQVLIFHQQITGSIPNLRFLEQAGGLFNAFPNKIVLCDSRHYGDQLSNVCLKVNQIEAARLSGINAEVGDLIPIHETKVHAKELFDKTQKPVFVTCGPNGLVAADANGRHHVPGIQVMKQIDPVGAGDTITSALAICLAEGSEALSSARFANVAAAVATRKLPQPGTASAEEIRELAQDVDYIYQPDLAGDIRSAAYFEETHIELCTALDNLELGKISHVIFDHDGTINTLHEGWHEIMEEMMVRAILGGRYDSIEPHVFQGVVRQVREYIDTSTGVQTILQMATLVDMVRYFGFVPESEILDKFHYKKNFYRQLAAIVDQRIGTLNQEHFDVSDYTLKGAVDFLAQLSARRMTLYLASGSDLELTRRDAEILGYAHYFNGGIYGSVDDVKKFSKKLLIAKILRENNLIGSNLAVFGDGPVEIRECRKQGGLAVGVASDEVRRYGLNAGKRRRLIRAGCDIIVPDFSQQRELLGLLFPA